MESVQTEQQQRSQEEVALARDLLAGRAEAFDPFVNLFRSKLFRYSFLVCRQREDAEEITQEALLRVFQNLHQLKEPERIRPWVFRIARNACLMKRRKSVFAPDHELSLDELQPVVSGQDGHKLIEIADWSALPEDQVLRSELRMKLEEAIAALPDIYKTVLLLRDVEELTTDEAAEALDISSDAVKTRLHRARLVLRQALDGYVQSAQKGKRMQ